MVSGYITIIFNVVQGDLQCYLYILQYCQCGLWRSTMVSGYITILSMWSGVIYNGVWLYYNIINVGNSIGNVFFFCYLCLLSQHMASIHFNLVQIHSEGRGSVN